MSDTPMWPAVAGIVAGAALVGGSLLSARKKSYVENPLSLSAGMSRRPKEDRSIVASHHLGLRLNDHEHRMLGTIVNTYNKKMRDAGFPAIASATSIVRMLIEQEFNRLEAGENPRLRISSYTENAGKPRADRRSIASRAVGLRLTDAEFKLIKTLVDATNQRMIAAGFPPKASMSSVVLMLIKQESVRLGLTPSGHKNPQQWTDLSDDVLIDAYWFGDALSNDDLHELEEELKRRGIDPNASYPER